MLIADLVLILVFSFVLMKSTDLLVGALNRLSGETKLEKFGLTAFLIALSTSLPEVFVGITAAIEGNSVLSLGNVLGSNIANVSLVIGGAALIGGSVGVVGDFLRRDFFTAFLAASLPLLLLLDGTLGYLDGVALLFIYGVYNVTTLWKKPHYQQKQKLGAVHRIFRKLQSRYVEKQILWLVVGSALLIVSADMLVRSAMRIAANFGAPMFLVGLFLVAVGTSLPELSFEIGAIRKREVGMVYGNLLGSVVANSTLVLGLTALFNPIRIGVGLKSYFLATAVFVVIFAVFWLFVRSKKKLERWEGGVLLILYFIFVFLEFWKAR